MRSRYYRYRRVAALAACLGSTAAVATLASAGTAMASVECTSRHVYGSGSSFQNTAQASFKKTWGEAGNTSCLGGSPPASTYSATSSGEGLEVFGMGTGGTKGVLQPQLDKEAEKGPCTALDEAGKCLDLYVGSDDAPTTEQLESATTASGGLSDNGKLAAPKNHRAAVAIPVAQGPVALILSLPAGCKVESNSRIDVTNEAWAQLFEGVKGIAKTTNYAEGTWGAFLEHIGYTKVSKESELSADPTFFDAGSTSENLPRFYAAEETYEEHTKAQIKADTPAVKVKLPYLTKTVTAEGCKESLKPQVRSSESGTSYATKAYFNQINEPVWKAFVSDAAKWPEESWVTKENQETKFQAPEKGTAIPNKKGSQLAEAAASTPGSVGYADTADAAKGGGSTSRATLSQKAIGSTIVEMVENGEEENGTTHVKEKVFEQKAEPAKSISHEILYADVQNNGVKPAGENGKGATYALPLVEGGAIANQANCETNELVAGDKGFPKHWNESWNGTITSDPDAATVSSEVYPACAITYDVAWHHYRNVNLYGNTSHTPKKLANEMAATAKDYFEAITGTVGQTKLKEGGYYVSAPKAMQAYIRAAVKNIGP